MGKFDDVLLASDFDNTILNTERPRRTGGPIPPVSQGNLTAIRYFMAEGGRFAVATGGRCGVPDVCGQGADERPGHRVQRRGAV